MIGNIAYPRPEWPEGLRLLHEACVAAARAYRVAEYDARCLMARGEHEHVSLQVAVIADEALHAAWMAIERAVAPAFAAFDTVQGGVPPVYRSIPTPRVVPVLAVPPVLSAHEREARWTDRLWRQRYEKWW